MCCLGLILGFIGPRAALVYMWLTRYLDGVFQSTLWLVLGFLFMPYTTLAYAFAQHNGGPNGIWLIVLIVAAIIDLGMHGGSAKHGRRGTD